MIAAIVVANAVLGLRAGGAGRAGGRRAAAAWRRRRPASCATAGGADPGGELVRGDLLVLAEGDAVGADARLVEAASLRWRRRR